MARIIPTLFVNKNEMETPQEIVSYLLKFMLNNPGWTSSQIEGQLLSMRKFIAETSEDIKGLPAAIETVLTASIEKYLPGYKANVTSRKVSDSRYNLSITIVDMMGGAVFDTEDFIIENGEFILNTEAATSLLNQGDING